MDKKKNRTIKMERPDFEDPDDVCTFLASYPSQSKNVRQNGDKTSVSAKQQANQQANQQTAEQQTAKQQTNESLNHPKADGPSTVSLDSVAVKVESHPPSQHQSIVSLKRKSNEVDPKEDKRNRTGRDQQVPTSVSAGDSLPNSEKAANAVGQTAHDAVEEFLNSTFREFRSGMSALSGSIDRLANTDEMDSDSEHRAIEIALDSDLDSENSDYSDDDDDVIWLADFDPTANENGQADKPVETNEQSEKNETETSDRPVETNEKNETSKPAEQKRSGAPAARQATAADWQVVDQQSNTIQAGMQFMTKIASNWSQSMYKCALCQPHGCKFVFRHLIVSHLLGKKHQSLYKIWLLKKNGVPTAALPPIYFGKPKRKPYIKPEFRNHRPPYHGWQKVHKPHGSYQSSFHGSFGWPGHQPSPAPPADPYSRPFQQQPMHPVNYADDFACGPPQNYGEPSFGHHANGHYEYGGQARPPLPPPTPANQPMASYTDEDRYLQFKTRKISPNNDDLLTSYGHLKTVNYMLKKIAIHYNLQQPRQFNANNPEDNHVLKHPVRVGLFAKKLSLKDDYKMTELVVACQVLPTIGLLRLIRDQLAFKLQSIPNETYTVVENPGLTSIDVKASNGLLIRIMLTSNLIRDKLTAMQLDKELNKEACIRALDSLIKFNWYKMHVNRFRPIPLVIKLCRHLAKREANSWAAFDNWQLQVLCYDIIRGKFDSEPSPAVAFKYVLYRLAGGYLIDSGSFVADPCRTNALHKENFLRRMSLEEKRLITESAGRFNLLAKTNQLEKIFGDSKAP